MEKINNLETWVLIIPEKDTSIETFRMTVCKNISNIFEIDDEKRLKPLEEFLENKDHWFNHSLNVYKKALEVWELMEKKWYEIDKVKLFIMAFMHDSWRFHLSEENPKKRIRCEKRHNKCWEWQIRLARKKLDKRWIKLEDSFWNSVYDYIENHDFLNDRLDPNYKEPNSLEWQIVRLSDRISTDIETEIDRYWETWKRLNTTYFISDISFEDRINFNFTKVGEYINSKKFDEFTFFLALISVSKNDYQNDDLKQIYSSWAESKDLAIKKILEIRLGEWYSTENIEKMRNLINDYIKHFNIKY